MSSVLSELLDSFTRDPWRDAHPFSVEVQAAQSSLFAAPLAPDERQRIINGWIQKYQPCLFGKAAASQAALHYCFLSEDDVRSGDDMVRQRIQDAHLRWTRETFEGRSSGFLVLFISERAARAEPNLQVLSFAKLLGQLYLQEDEIEVDHIYHDTAYLAVPDHRERVLRWKAGVNYFAAHADGRWWQDHRIPGGIGFSTNSVGHLVKSGKLLNLLDNYTRELGLDASERDAPRIDSLARALQFAMQTIDSASMAVSGKATELLPLGERTSTAFRLQCPVKLPAKLADKDFCSYRGYYHTDYTLPSDYFRPDVARPTDVRSFDDLDFTYLFDRSLENPAHFTMGEGQPIRSDEISVSDDYAYKRGRLTAEEIMLEGEPRLRQALQIT